VIAEGPPSWPPADEAVRQALDRAYTDGSWGQYHGPHVELLEARLAQMHGVDQVRTCCSGTFAVELALRSLGVRAGDEVILAGYDFGGNFRSIEAIGAKPVLVDIGENDWCMDIEQIAEAVSPKTRAVVASHMHGCLVRMRELRSLADKFDLRLVEDACQTPGATVDGRMAGSWGDVGVLSFGGSKLLTAGRGGAILTGSPQVSQRAKVFCSQGNDAFALSQLQALVLLPQLETLASRNQQRLEAVDRLLQHTAAVSALCNFVTLRSDCAPAYFKVAWLYDEKVCGGASREEFCAAVRAEGVALDKGFRSFAQRPASRCRQAGPLSNSRRAGQQTVVLHHPILLAETSLLDQTAEAMIKVERALEAKED